MDDAGNGRRADMGDQLVVVFLGGSDRILIIVFLPVFVTGHDLYYPAAIMFFQSGTKVVAGMEKEGVAGRAGSGIDGGRKRVFLPDEVVEIMFCLRYLDPAPGSFKRIGWEAYFPDLFILIERIPIG